MRIYIFLVGLFFYLSTSMAQAATFNFNGVDVSNCNRSGAQYTCDNLSMADTDVIVIASGYGVTVNSSLKLTYNQGLTMSGNAALTVMGNFDITGLNASKLQVTGGSLTAKGGTFSMGALTQTISANISATTVKMGTAHVIVTGSITAKGLVEIASGSTIRGPISGDVVNILPANSVVEGDITAKTTLTIGSGNAIKGNVEGGNVTLDAANGYITGNALVDHITLGSWTHVDQTITCKAYTPANPCSCVTNNSGWPAGSVNGPKCGPGTPTGPHHFQIDHPGTALTCAPQTVTVTACADAACSSKYVGGATVTLSPGGISSPSVQVDSTGMVNTTVRQYEVGSATLSLTSVPGATGALVCKRASDKSASCMMDFAATGLIVTPVNHVSAKQQAFGISAVQASPNQQACVPLFANKSKDLSLACSYSNPATGSLPVFIKGTGGFIALAADNSSACSALGKTVNLAFDDKGVATAIMSYADVGKVNLKATYTGSSSSGDSGLSMTGNADVIVVPKRFVFGAITTPQRAGLAVTPVVPATTISVSALNDVGAVTPNFGKEATAQTVQLGHAIVAPLFTGRLDPEVAGSLTFNNGNGIGTAANMVWPEVGTIQFTATLPAYLGWTPPPVNGIPQPLAIGNSADVQFIPHHFATAVTGTVPMRCVAPLTCVGAQPGQTVGNFVYSRQAFGLRVTAQNASNVTTINFDGQDKSLPANVALQGYDAATGKTAMPPANPAGSQLTDGTAAQTVVTGIAPSNFIGGVANTVIAYRFPGAYALPAGAVALAPPTDVLFRATTTYPGGAVVTSAPSASGTEGQLTILTGRMMVPNSYGSERLPIRLPVQVQYWNGGWVSNASDSVTTFTQTGVVLANCRKSLSSGAGACNGATKVQDGIYTFVAGFLPSPNGRLMLLAPGVPGSVDVSVPGLSYLPSTVGSVVFGILRSGPLIYLREMY